MVHSEGVVRVWLLWLGLLSHDSFVFRLGTAGQLALSMVLQCYDFLTDSAIPIDRYLLLYGGVSWEEGVRRSPKGGYIYM